MDAAASERRCCWQLSLCESGVVAGNLYFHNMRSGIPFNYPFLTGKETEYIRRAVESGKISGDGVYTRLCHEFFGRRYGFRHPMLTTSCTDALEMSAMLLDLDPGDEVIVPSYTFVSTANAYVLRGARIRFADSCQYNPNIDASQVAKLITCRTKAIVVVHYAGVACDMDAITSLACARGVAVIEDAAQAIDSYYRNRPLGSIGDMSAFSFHETKNVMAGEGGMLVLNREDLVKRAEIIREKGTNRAAFFRGEIDKYNWIDIGSSYLPSDIIAAFLYAQLEHIDEIQTQRKSIWNCYYEHLKGLQFKECVRLPYVPDYATQNGHMFYLVCRDLDERTRLISFLRERGIGAVFHYQSLHNSPFYRNLHDGRKLIHSDNYSDTLLRLPLYYSMSTSDVDRVIDAVSSFYVAK